jgi:hypothetical protein
MRTTLIGLAMVLALGTRPADASLATAGFNIWPYVGSYTLESTDGRVTLTLVWDNDKRKRVFDGTASGCANLTGDLSLVPDAGPELGRSWIEVCSGGVSCNAAMRTTDVKLSMTVFYTDVLKAKTGVPVFDRTYIIGSEC